MLETLAYTTVAGTRQDHSITIYSLSTCGFCKRAMSFLNDRGFAYRYIHVDTIPLETKTEVKRLLKEKFSEDVAFPFAVIDANLHLVGFIEADWKRTLGVE
jgi:glutaredoxin